MSKKLIFHKCLVCKSEHLYIDNYKGKYQVVCKSCTTSTSKSYETEIMAIDAWNLMHTYCNKREAI